MHRKTSAIRLGIFVLVVAIVVPLASNVNHFTKVFKRSVNSLEFKADGPPIPPVPPTKGTSLVADGPPIPPVPPHTTLALIADGPPIPPVPPTVTTLSADGPPIPPIPPPKLVNSKSYGSQLAV